MAEPKHVHVVVGADNKANLATVLARHKGADFERGRVHNRNDGPPDMERSVGTEGERPTTGLHDQPVLAKARQAPARSLALAAHRATSSNRGGVIGAAAKAARAQSNAQADPPVTPGSGCASLVVDLNKRTAMERLGVASLKRLGIASFISSRTASRRRGGRYGAEPPPEWTGAAKLVRDLGDTVTCVAVSEDDSLFAAGSIYDKGHNAMVYSTTTGATVASFKAKSAVNAVCFAGVGEQALLIAGCMSGDLHMWHVNDGTVYYEHKFIGSVNSIAVMDDCLPL